MTFIYKCAESRLISGNKLTTGISAKCSESYSVNSMFRVKEVVQRLFRAYEQKLV